MTIQGRFLEYLDAAEEALSQYGPAVVDATLLWARVDAASGLVVPFLGVIGLAVVWAWPMRVWWDEALSLRKSRRDEFYIVVPGIVSAALGAITFAAISSLLDIWRWVGLFVPELWLMHKAISAITGGA